MVTAHVYHSTFSGPLKLDALEVASAMWTPFSVLTDPEKHVGYTSSTTADLVFPGIEVGEPGRHVVWGLTYRFLEIFMEAVGRPLPDRPVVGEIPASWRS